MVRKMDEQVPVRLSKWQSGKILANKPFSTWQYQQE
jgi:hypothetical protein